MAPDGDTPVAAVSADQPQIEQPAEPTTPATLPKQAHIVLADEEPTESAGSAASPGLRNSKGWDGKLRLPKKDALPPASSEAAGAQPSSGKHAVVLANPEALSDPEYSDDDHVVPGDTIAPDEDLLNDEDPDTDEIVATQSRIHSIAALRLGRFRHLQKLCLRQNSIQSVDAGLEAVAGTLQELDVYDNLVSHMRGVEKLPNLTTLDLSFNKIKHIKHLAPLTKLVDLYLVANKVASVDGLGEVAEPAKATLRMVELGSNRIRSIAPLGGFGFVALEELWLAKNKITSLEGLKGLPKLRLLSVQSNRLTDLSPLQDVPSLEELYVSHNALTSLESLRGRSTKDESDKTDAKDAKDANSTNGSKAGAPKEVQPEGPGEAPATPVTLPRLRVLDISNNQIPSFTGVEHLASLEEVWASYNRIADFADVERCLRDKAKLDTVYLEGNPLQLRSPALYRNKVRLALPQVTQIDATYVRET